jgi:hypothetical protein
VIPQHARELSRLLTGATANTLGTFEPLPLRLSKGSALTLVQIIVEIRKSCVDISIS